MPKQHREQTEHVKNVQDKQLNKLRQPEDREVQTDESMDGERFKSTDDNIIDQAQDKVASEFVESELTPDQYVERTEIAAKELEGDTEVTPSEPEENRSPEQ